MTSVTLNSLPHWLEIDQRPQSWRTDGHSLSLIAGPRTDLFLDPQGAQTTINSPRLMFAPRGEFMFSARVRVNFAATYDAGVLLVYADETHWAKLCFEYSPQQQPMIVSVVTKGSSDDCNSIVFPSDQVYLRVSGLQGAQQAFAFHYSHDAHNWHLVRYFSLGLAGNTRVGFSAQSPTGEVCQAIFDQIQYSPTRLADLRSGE